MKKSVILISCLALTLAFVPGSAAGQSKDAKPKANAPEAVVYDAASAFAFLKTLAGDWERGSGDHEHGSSSREANFKVTAAGSSVVETLYAGQPTEMVSIFHMDGSQLLLTH
jgi:ABC-type molybdate transport system substrate-binding protein